MLKGIRICITKKLKFKKLRVLRVKMKPILYFGDTSLSGAARYLSGVMHNGGYEFDYIASDKKISLNYLGKRKLFILSDYPYKNLDYDVEEEIIKQVKGGAGLLMIGGWESFCGLGGDWNKSKISELLPVNILSKDDRINCSQQTIIIKNLNHPIIDKLPWKSPPSIGGFNQVISKKESLIILSAQTFKVSVKKDEFQFKKIKKYPLLIVGEYGSGRTATLTTDVAPHWVGGFVDWGNKRIKAKAPRSEQIEVGNFYMQFFSNLVSWTAKF